MLVMNSKKITLSAMFLAIGIILPFITMNIPVIGKMLLPMHIPVLLAGFIIGPVYGALLGVLTPLVRSFMFGVPYFIRMLLVWLLN
jgi:predicted membrane protein